ncbi:efflux RND transporter periplasmic adaptor subunit [Leucothrix mucor]|uniref:efflux RND transporter periplasmic adaptor subunit n=1 Tax=Leucothrix mucor TaxID=45248 RepID=UPI0003B3DBCD|nr:efflux RND transporter periplasmic adaptor subunit [Leucothrix mucor]
MKKLIILLILLLVGGGSTYYYYQNQTPPVAAADIIPELNHSFDKLLGRAQDENENELLLYGNIDIRETQLAFNSSEHIAKILVEEGEHVKKGQLLAYLHNEVLNAQLIEAEAQVEGQTQTVHKLKAGARSEEIEKLRAEYHAAQAQASVAASSYQRLIPLARKRMVTPDDLDKAHALSESTKAQAEAVRHALILMQSGNRKEDIAAAESLLRSYQANVSLVNQQLENAKLFAPNDGVIRNRILEEGSMAFPSTPAMTLAVMDPIWVRAYIPEPALGKVALGSPAKIYTDSFPDKVYEGWVGYISPTSEFTPKTVQTTELRTKLVYSARIFACNPADELRLGMPATVRIDISQPPASQKKGTKHCGQS